MLGTRHLLHAFASNFKSEVWQQYFCPHFVCLVAQSCPTLCDPMVCSLPSSSIRGDSPGKNTGEGCHAFLQGIFPIQGSNSGLLHCRRNLYHLSHQGSPTYKLLLGIYLKDLGIYLYQKTFTRRVLGALFIMSSNWK